MHSESRKPLWMALEEGAAAVEPADMALDLWMLQGEAMGWLPLGDGGYWHGPGAKASALSAARAGGAGGASGPVGADVPEVIHVVGCPDPALDGLVVLLLT